MWVTVVLGSGVSVEIVELVIGSWDIEAMEFMGEAGILIITELKGYWS